MTDAPTSGVLLRGADGSHYFIPHSDLSSYAVKDPHPQAAEQVEANAPRLDAFDVQKAGEDAPPAEAWLAEGDGAE
jgi:hypothetical protein